MSEKQQNSRQFENRVGYREKKRKIPENGGKLWEIVLWWPTIWGKSASNLAALPQNWLFTTPKNSTSRKKGRERKRALEVKRTLRNKKREREIEGMMAVRTSLLSSEVCSRHVLERIYENERTKRRKKIGKA